jgi:hypothetical protein
LTLTVDRSQDEPRRLDTSPKRILVRFWTTGHRLARGPRVRHPDLGLDAVELPDSGRLRSEFAKLYGVAENSPLTSGRMKQNVRDSHAAL